MAILEFPADFGVAPSLVREPVILRRPRFNHFEAWRALRECSRAHLTRWEPDWREEDVTAGAFREKVKAYQRAARRGAAAPFFVFHRSTNELLGAANLLTITRGASQSAVLGYWIGAAHTRRGYCENAVRAILDFAFDDLALHRVEAACQPANKPSAGLLEKLTFRCEGRAREYLRINGVWRDHDLYAVTAREWRDTRK